MEWVPGAFIVVTTLDTWCERERVRSMDGQHMFKVGPSFGHEIQTVTTRSIAEIGAPLRG
jgi:hypothetical protein